MLPPVGNCKVDSIPIPRLGIRVNKYGAESQGGGEQGFFVSQDIVLGGKLGLSRRVFEQEKKQAEAEGEEQRLRVINSVRLFYYQALAAQEMVDLRRKLSQLAEDAVQHFAPAWQRWTSGPTRRAASRSRRRAGGTGGGGGGAEAAAGLALAGGDSREASDAADAPCRAILRTCPKTIPINGYRRSCRTVQRSRSRSWGCSGRRHCWLGRSVNRSPICNFGAGFSKTANWTRPQTGPIGLQGFAEVGVQIPIFNRNQGNVQASRADVERAQREVQRVQLVLRERAAALVQNYVTSRAMVERYRNRMIPRAQKAYELYVKSYGGMAAAYPQVLISQRTLFQLQTDYIAALETLWGNSIALKGFLLTDGLEAPSRPGGMDQPVRELNVPSPTSSMQPQ